jgi:hypothetical protein
MVGPMRAVTVTGSARPVAIWLRLADPIYDRPYRSLCGVVGEGLLSGDSICAEVSDGPSLRT